MKKERTVLQRIAALLIVFAMVMNNNAFVLSADLNEAVREEAVPEIAAETAAPETAAPETQAPETAAPETQAPETQAPETQAPETQAPETTAPETEAQDYTEAEVQTEEMQTPGDMVEEAVLDTAEQETVYSEFAETDLTESESETETESETEEAKPAFETEKTFEESKVTVTITAEEGVLPEGATAEISELDYEDDVQDVLDTELVNEGKGSIDAAMYDVVLYNKEGESIQPEGKVTIRVKGMQMDIPEEYAELITYRAVRINDDESLTILKDQMKTDEEIVEFENDHFTAVGIAAVADIDAMAAALLADDFPYQANSNGKGIWITLDDGQKYIAYCFNRNRGTPNSNDGKSNAYRLEFSNASAEEMWSDVETGNHTNATEDTIKVLVSHVIYAGMPYNADINFTYTDRNGKTYECSNAEEFAKKVLKMSDSVFLEKLEMATQYAIWHFTDDETNLISYSTISNEAKCLAGFLVRYAEAQTSAAPGVELDLYEPEDPSTDTHRGRQNLLVPRAKVGELLTPQDPNSVEPGSGSGSVQAVIKAKKTIDNGATPIGNNEFTFELKDANGQIVATAKNDSDGNISFGPLTGLSAGTHNYTIVETGGPAGFTYDTSAKTVQIVVTAHDLQTFDSSKVYYGHDMDGYHTYYMDVAKNQSGIRVYCTNQNTIGPKQGDSSKQTYRAFVNPSLSTVLSEKLVNTTGRAFGEAEYAKLKKLFYYLNTPDAQNLQEYSNAQKLVWCATGSSTQFSISDEDNVKINGKVVTAASGQDMLNQIDANIVLPDGYNVVFFQPTGDQVNSNPQPLGTGYGTSVSYATPEIPTFNNTTSEEITKEYEVEISKIDIGGEEIKGAKLKITDKNGTVVEEWTSVEGQSYKSKLQPGEYTLTEETAPNGYAKAESIKFSVDKDGNVKVFNEETQEFEDADKVTMVDGYEDQEAEFSKTDVNGKELAGAKIEIRKDSEDGEVIAEWTSGEDGNNQDGSVKTHTIQLQPGTYVMTETTAPKGYAVAESIKFSVDKDGIVKVFNEETQAFEATDKVTMVDDYADQEVEISKTDIGGEEIKGAKLKITDKNGTVVEEWTSVEGQSYKSKLQPGEYTLTEETAPKGYVTAESIKFSVDKDGNVKVFNEETQEYEEADKVTMVDDYADQEVEISKTDIGGEEIKGAKLKITDKNGTVVEEWTSVEGQSYKSKLQPGEYTLTEETAPNGYVKAESIKFSVNKDGNVKVFNEETQAFEEADKVTMVDGYEDQEAEFSKTDVNGKELAGAKIEIRKETEDGDVVAQWTSGDDGEDEDGNVKTHTIQIQPGTYVMKETTAPDGYEVAESIKFSVDKDGSVKVFNEETQVFEATDKVTMVDDYADQEVEISKTDIGGEEIEGAKLKITDKNGTVVEEWTSVVGQSYKSKLQPGEYTLTEETAPNGYVTAESIKFSVDMDGNVKVFNEETQAYEAVDKLTMVDDYADQEVEISKTDIGGEEIEGAKLKITDKNGTVVEEWTSVEGQSYKSKLQPGEYTLTEETAPNGYVTAESIRFSVDKDGIVKVFNEKTQAFEEADKVTMVDGYEDQKAEFSKTDVNGKELAGAKIEIRKESEDGDVVAQWTSGDDGEDEDGNVKTHTIQIQPGTYVMTETTAPKGYAVAESIKFSVDKDGIVKVFNEETQTFEEADKVTMVDDYADQEVEISKTDIGGEEIEGAKLKITDKNGTVVDQWTSEEGKSHTSKLKPGSYTLTETTAPKGYEVAESIEFTVDKDGVVTEGGKEVKKVVMVDAYSNHDVEVSKTDIGGEEIEGAKLEITDKDGKVVDQWTSEKGKSHKSKLQPGTYTLTEKTAPKGYEVAESIEFTVDKDGNVTVGGENVDKVVMEDAYSDQEVKISKTDIGGEEIEGAELEIIDKDRKVVDQWTSEKGKSHKSKLQPGTYTLTEKTAPKGYEVAESIEFTVDKDGKVTVGGKNVDKVVMEDAYSDQEVEISKTDIGGEEIEGAKLEITDKDGKVVDQWTSEKGKSHKSSLQPETYTLTETIAPKDYAVAESIKFSVDKDGIVKVFNEETQAFEEADKVTMVDDYADHDVEISKTDIGGKEIEGAKLTITDKDGKNVDSWTSKEGKSHTSKLKPGSYILTETTAPKGYEVAESIKFTVDKEGNVTTGGNKADKIVMVDAYSDQIVEISKTDISGEEIEGAKLEITDKDGKVVDQWTSEEGKSHKSSLQPGTYTLTEKTAPKGYEVAESIEFTVDKEGNVTTGGNKSDKIVMVDAYSDQIVEISKTDVGGKEIEGAKLEITDKDGNVVDSWTSEEGKSHKSSLQPGTYTLTEKTAPKGYEIAESIEFSVDKDGVVTVGGKEVKKVVMVDKLKEAEKQNKSSNGGGNKSGTGTSPAKTGDETPIALYLILLAFAGAAAVVLFRKRKNHAEK